MEALSIGLAYTRRQKIAWAAEIIRLNTSVLWVDLDIFYFKNPVAYLFRHLPLEADIVLQSEGWVNGWTFKGEMCRVRNEVREKLGWNNKEGEEAARILCSGRSCEDSMCADEFQPDYPLPGKNTYYDCCDTNINGGQWLVNPTEGGSMFINQWFAKLHEDSVVKEKMWNGSAELDQGFAWHTLHQLHDGVTPLYRWNTTTRAYENYMSLHRNGVHSRAYVISVFRWQYRCGGICGCSGVMTNFKPEWRKINGTERLICGMREKDRDRIISIHANCGSGAEAKRDAMKAWRGLTIDKDLYSVEAKTYCLMYYPWLHDPRNKTGAVFPDW